MVFRGSHLVPGPATRVRIRREGKESHAAEGRFSFLNWFVEGLEIAAVISETRRKDLRQFLFHVPFEHRALPGEEEKLMRSKVGVLTTAAVLVAVTVGATSALAQSLIAIPKITNRQDGAEKVGVYPRGITPDGRFVGGTAGLGFNSDGQNTGFVYDVATGVAGHIVAGGYNANVDGIGYWTDGTTTKVVIEGANGGSQSMNWWDTSVAWDGTAYWTKNRRTGTAYYGSGQNRVAGTSHNGLLHGVFQTDAFQPNVDAFNGTGFADYDFKSTSQETTMNGVSNAGLSVGVRGGRMFYVGPYVGGTTPPNGYIAAGPDGTDVGSLYDIADDGSIMGGYGQVTGKTGWYPFVYDGSTSFELPNLGGGFLNQPTNGAVYSIAPNGDYAVGMDYSYGIEKAVLWDLRDMDNIQALDLTQFAIDHGILGPFTGNLRRATAIGIDAQGNPVIAGVGYAGSLEASGWTGFVMTVPEPATMSLLVLGALPLLRRRRR